MAESPRRSTCICAICFQAVQDARLLTCFHSFCKSCLDDLDMRTGHEHKIKCPLCRSTSRLPEKGASGLTRDITVAVKTTSECDTCRADCDRKGKAEVSCTTCDLSFCKEHAGAHVLAKSKTGHHLVALAEHATSPSSGANLNVHFARLCDDHGLPARYYCKQCGVAVCGDCTTLYEHRDHKPIVAVTDLAHDLKQRVRQMKAGLKNTRLPNVQRCLLAVEDVSSQLSSRAEITRSKIRSSAKHIHDLVDIVMEEKLAEVDNLEELRLKHLNCQHDELKQHVDSLKSVISFSEKVLEADMEAEEICKLLIAVEKRAEELDKASVAKEPVEHARVDFKSASKTLREQLGRLIGVVMPCHATAAHSFVAGEAKRTCLHDSPVSFVVVAKDCNDRFQTTGGDVIEVDSQQTAVAVDPLCDPTVIIVDNKNGTYKILVTAYQHGEYLFGVHINNEALEERLLITCLSPVAFDPAECQSGLKVSQDRLTVTNVNGAWSSVLSSSGMSAGQHVWKVKVAKSQNMYVFLGVAEKPGLTAKRNNQNSTFSFYGLDGSKRIMGQSVDSCMHRWQDDDVLQLHMNCTNHTLSLTNLRTRDTDRISNLPPTELFAYFFLGSSGDSITLVA